MYAMLPEGGARDCTVRDATVLLIVLAGWQLFKAKTQRYVNSASSYWNEFNGNAKHNNCLASHAYLKMKRPGMNLIAE